MISETVLVQSIMTSPNLSKGRKLAALENLAIAADDGVDINFDTDLTLAFSWDTSRQGARYWREMYITMRGM